MSEALSLEYTAEPTAFRFHQSRALVKGLMGPFGSGKTTACIWELLMMAGAQDPQDNIRRTRFAVVRNTYPELKSTTIKTWQATVPASFGEVVFGAPITCNLNYVLADQTVVQSEILFLSLDRPDDVKKVLSLDVTAVYVNEARELPKAIIDALTARVARYPPKDLGGPTRYGVIMDTNPPDDDHWWYNMFEVEKPKGWECFKQPAALIQTAKKEWIPNPAAENVSHQSLGYQYWLNLTAGKTDDWIKVYVEGKYGAIRSGRPVYPEYNDEWHCAKAPIDPAPGLSLIIGMDIGCLCPSAAICQFAPVGQLRVLDELCSSSVGLRPFLKFALKPFLAERYGGLSVQVRGDPHGSARAPTDERTCYEILADEGYPAYPALTNDFVPRREAVAKLLMSNIGGEPAFLLSPRCKMLRKGFISKYALQRIQVPGEERYKDAPEDNDYHHVHAALQYAALGSAPPTITIRASAAPIKKSTYRAVV